MQVLITPVTMFQQNCSLLWCPETLKGAIVDPGGDTARVLAQAQKAGVTIEKLLITHAHIDHAGATAQLARELGIPIEGPQREDQFWIDLLPEQGARYGFAPAETFVPDRWLEHGDTVTVGNLSLNVVHCPGHTPGHVVFFESQSQVAFVGDVLFQGSVGRTDFPRGDHATLIRSITERLWPLGNDVTFVPGHGPTSTFGQERKTNPYVGDHALR
jgi:glyoxylase-like metal-dependent hydrolase (beta-lactamase superfamily II)